MSRSEDENELDSYGVWVKPEPEENNDNQQKDDSLDLPDFDDTDFSDMFKEDISVSAQDFGSDLDSTLSADELANITSGTDVTIEETTSPEAGNSIDFDFEESVKEENIAEDFVNEPVPETSNIDETEVPKAEETTADDTFNIEEEISLDDFMDGGFSDESVASGNNGFEEGKQPAPAASPAPASETEEISLDDFVDMGDFGVDNTPAEPKPDEIVDEAPLDIDISFDSSVETVATEDNDSAQDDILDEDEMESSTESESTETEEVSLDDFDTTIDNAVKSDNQNIETEEIDLSDFGIDADAEETPITQDVEEAKNKEVIVDYDLSIGDENTSAAPVVNEIKTTANAESPIEENMTEIKNEVPAGSEVVESSLLQQILDDLSGLKDEINELKTNLAEIKANEKTAVSEETFPEENFVSEENVSVEENVSEENFEAPVESSVTEESFDNTQNTIEETVDTSFVQESEMTEEPSASEENLDLNFENDNNQSSGGFFDMDDGDDTIALSGDELNNIFNSAEFQEIQVDSPVEANAVIDSTIEEPAENIASESDELPDTIEEQNIITEDSFDQNVNVDASKDDEFDLSSDLPDQLPDEEAITENETVSDESENLATEEIAIEKEEEQVTIADFDNSEDEEKIDETMSNFSNVGDDDFNFEDENLEAPNFDENELILDDGGDDLPDEISIPKQDESTDDSLIVETNDEDFMSSVTDSTEITEEIAADAEEDNSAEESFDFNDAIENEPAIETDVPTETEDFTFESTESVVSNDETAFEESAEDETPVTEEPVFEETPSFDESPVFEEPAEEESPVIEESPVVEESPVFEETQSNTEVDDFSFDTVDSVLNDETPFETETPIPETTESEFGEQEIAETSDNDASSLEKDFNEIDNPDNNLSESNIDYLTTKDDIPAEETQTEDDKAMNSDLKKDIKSVLLYMDQLLENLPEEKIVEFAKSDEFATYKKLFSELGLS